MNYNIILVRFSEICLKSNFVRNRLQTILKDNIRAAIKKRGVIATVKRKEERILIETDEFPIMIDILKHTFGVFNFSLACEIPLENLENFIAENAHELVRKNTFAVKVKREGKHNFTSKEMEIKLGEILVGKTGKKVNLKNPEDTVFVEIREKEAYIFSEKIPGPGGLPLGSQGEVACFVEDERGIVACWLAMKRGCKPVIYHSINVDDLDKWSHEKLKKIFTKDPFDVNRKTIVLGSAIPEGLEEIRRFRSKFVSILTPTIAFTDKEIKEFLMKIKT